MRPPSPTPRFPDWPERLAAFIESRRATPFAWGGHDCCLFAADAVLALTGVDRAATWRGRYATEAGAMALLSRPGGLYGLMREVEDIFGVRQVPPLLAQRGDTALVQPGNLPTMGVVLDQVVAAPGLDGMQFVPLAGALRAWMT